jgi:hypothetical protein
VVHEGADNGEATGRRLDPIGTYPWLADLDLAGGGSVGGMEGGGGTRTVLREQEHRRREGCGKKREGVLQIAALGSRFGQHSGRPSNAALGR